MQVGTRGELEQLGDALLEPLFRSRRVSGSSVSRCLHSRRNTLSSLNSVCPSNPQYPDPLIQQARPQRAAASNARSHHPDLGRQNDAMWCGVPSEVDLKGRTHILAFRC